MVTANNENRATARPKRISGILDDLLGRLGIARQYHGWAIVSDWPEIVGKTIADKTEAVRFADGILFVSVKSDAWRQELSLQKAMILEKIKTLPHGRAIKQIRLIRGPKG